MNYIVSLDNERIAVTVDETGSCTSDEPLPATLTHVPGTPVFLLRIGDAVHRVILRARHARGCFTLWLDGFSFEVEALDERSRAIRDLTAMSGSRTGPAPLIAPMPGLVVRVNVRPGDRVRPGQGLVIMEAMKMENELRSHAEGTVKAVPVVAGTAVEKGTVLVELE
jgi:pyruvate carboxylase subunit B